MKNIIEEISNAVELPFQQLQELEKKLSKKIMKDPESLKSIIKNEDVRIRRSVVEMIRMNINKNKTAVDILKEHYLIESDIKTKRRIIRAIGESLQNDLCQFLLDQLKDEKHRYIQASLILALGKLGFKDWNKKIFTEIEKNGPVTDALKLAIGHTSGQRENIITKRPIGKYLLKTYQGIEKYVKQELKENKEEGLTLSPGWLLLDSPSDKTSSAIGKLKLILDDYYLFQKTAVTNDSTVMTEHIVKLAEFINSLDGGTKVTGFRVVLPRKLSRLKNIKIVKKISKIIEKNTSWLNNPSNYDIELRLVEINDNSYFIFKDRRWQTYQRSDREILPASINTTVAAALCYTTLELCKKQGITDYDLLDPCCGAGTILEEWLNIVSTARVDGIDLSAKAVTMANKNLTSFKNRFTVKTGDMRNLPFQKNSRSCIVANLPFGIRVKSATSNNSLYHDFLKDAKRVLKPGGVIIIYTCDKKSVLNAVKKLKLKITSQYNINAGGLQVGVFSICNNKG